MDVATSPDKTTLDKNGAQLLTIKRINSTPDDAKYGSVEDLNSNLSLDPKGSTISLQENGTASLPASPRVKEKKKSAFKGLFKRGKKHKKDKDGLKLASSSSNLGGSNLSLASSIESHPGDGDVNLDVNHDVNLDVNHDVNSEADIASANFDMTGSSFNDISVSSDTGFNSPPGSSVSIDDVEGGETVPKQKKRKRIWKGMKKHLGLSSKSKEIKDDQPQPPIDDFSEVSSTNDSGYQETHQDRGQDEADLAVSTDPPAAPVSGEPDENLPEPAKEDEQTLEATPVTADVAVTVAKPEQENILEESDNSDGSSDSKDASSSSAEETKAIPTLLLDAASSEATEAEEGISPSVVVEAEAEAEKETEVEVEVEGSAKTNLTVEASATVAPKSPLIKSGSKRLKMELLDSMNDETNVDEDVNDDVKTNEIPTDDVDEDVTDVVKTNEFPTVDVDGEPKPSEDAVLEAKETSEAETKPVEIESAASTTEIAAETADVAERPDGEELPERLKFDIQIAGEVASADLPKTVVVGGNLKAEVVERVVRVEPVESQSQSQSAEELNDTEASSRSESDTSDEKKREGDDDDDDENDYYGRDSLSSATSRPMTPAEMRTLRNRGGKRAKSVWFQRFCCM